MRGIVLAVLSSLAVLGAWSAHAAETATGCLFKIGYSSWEPWECAVQDEGGTLTVSWPGAGDKGYLVRLVVAPDSAKVEAAWSGFAGGAHSTEPLGILSKDGNCWFNETARLCFTRQVDSNAYVSEDDSAADSREYDGEIAEELLGDEEEAERALANEQAARNSISGTSLAQADSGAPLANASSFRGLQLGMTESEIAGALPATFELSDDPASGLTRMLTPNDVEFGERGPGDKDVFIVSGNQDCGAVSFRGGHASKMRFFQCYFRIEGKIALEDFARQIIDNFGLTEGMTPHSQMRNVGGQRFVQLEYVGIKSAASERFAVATNDMYVYLTVQRVPTGMFN